MKKALISFAAVALSARPSSRRLTLKCNMTLPQPKTVSIGTTTSRAKPVKKSHPLVSSDTLFTPLNNNNMFDLDARFAIDLRDSSHGVLDAFINSILNGFSVKAYS